MFSKKSLKIALSLGTLLLAVLACTLTGTATPTPAPSSPTLTPTSGSTVTPTPPSLPVVTSPQIVSFRMLDADNGWALSDANVLRTTDGGTTWYNATPSGLTSVGFGASAFYLDASTAWVALPGSDPTNGRSSARCAGTLNAARFHRVALRGGEHYG